MQVFRNTFIPAFKWDKEYLIALVGILGTTISPYLFFWQASMEAEEENDRQLVVDKTIIEDMETDVKGGMLLTNVVFYFILLATGTVLYQAGIHEIDTVADAARALKPLAGKWSYLLFALGVLGTGFLAIPVLAGSLSYMLAECFSWEEGMSKKFHEARGFYYTLIISLVIGFSIYFTGISPMKALLYTAVLYGLVSPILIAVILHISNNPLIMGEYTNRRRTNVLGALTLLLMTASAGALLYFLFS
jgi:Mn2+/Fe2+ NRAMP family transporter